MENYNPLLRGISSKKFITIGEIMLRLTPPITRRSAWLPALRPATAAAKPTSPLALANLGIDSTFFSVVPNNSLGKSAVRWLRSNDVHCTPMILATPQEVPTHRLGTYYLETGYGIRASKVTYDRKHSAITEYDYSNVDLDALLDGYDWLHLSGITPALGENCRKLIMDCLKVAQEKGLTISFDGNFRARCGAGRTPATTAPSACPTSTCCSASSRITVEGRERPFQGRLEGRRAPAAQLRAAGRDLPAFYRAVPQHHLHCPACALRPFRSENSLKAFMWYEGHTFESKLFTSTSWTRVGGGDAFASGLIYAMMNNYKPMDMVNFAVASSAIKHTMHGDANITDDVNTIRNLMT